MNLIASDCSNVNLELLKTKYNIQTNYSNQIFYRFYNGKTENRFGNLFPLCDEEKLLEAIKTIIFSEKNPKFCLCDENQKNQIDKIFSQIKPNSKINWKSDEGDSDYIYLSENLSSLPGKPYQKKRNHISRFNKKYSNDEWKFVFADKSTYSENLKTDILNVLHLWKKGHEKLESESLLIEENAIIYALDNFSRLNLKCGILYIKGQSVAFCIASEISPDCIDIHFEKAIQEFAQDGAYAVINQQFAKCVNQFKYINREEDLNMEGLRKAKLSYKPTIILKKYYGALEDC